MIKLNDLEARNLYEAINVSDKNAPQGLGLAYQNVPYSLRLSYKAISSVIKETYQNGCQILDDLIKEKYGVKQEGMEGFVVPVEKMAEFEKEISELLSDESTEKEYAIIGIPESILIKENVRMNQFQETCLEKVIIKDK